MAEWMSNPDEVRGLRQRQDDDGCLEAASFQTLSDWPRTFNLSMCCSPVPLKHGVSGADFGMSCRGKAKTATSLIMDFADLYVDVSSI